MQARHNSWFWPLAWLALGAGYFLTGRLCIAVSAQVANVSWVLFIPAGLSLTSALLWGGRVWPGIFLGELGIGLTTGQTVAAAALMATGNGLDAGLAGWWFHDRPGRRIEFDRLADVVQLLVAELLILQPLSTALGVCAVTVSGTAAPGSLWSAATAWYASNVFAVFAAAPTALVWIRWTKPAVKQSEYWELFALTVLTLVVGAFGPGRWAIAGLPLPVTLLLSFPLLVWASVRFVPSVAITAGSVLGLFAFDAVLDGAGPLQAIPTGDRMFYLNVFMGVCLGTSLFLAAAMAQERRFEAEQARLIAELKASTQQVKRLEEFVTFCAWTGRVRSGDQWISVERFLKERYNVNISHGISEEALANLRKDAPPLPPPAAG